MRQSSFSESQRLAILAEQDAGHSVEVICRKHQVRLPFTNGKRILLSSKMKTNVE